MEGLFPDGDYQLDGPSECLYPLADFLRPVGDPLVDLRRRSLAVQHHSDKHDLVLLSAEGEKEWPLSSK